LKRPSRKTRIFISYSSRNRKEAEAVHGALDAKRFDIWRDQRRIETDWSSEIAQGLADADALCLIWTREAAESKWVKHEWLTARALDKLIVPCLFPGAPELPKPLENLHGVQFLKMAAGLSALAKRLKGLKVFYKRYELRTSPFKGSVPFSPDEHFTGREQDLVSLYLKMIGNLNKIGINQVGAVGMGGAGKTELAVEFAYRFGFAFDGVYWIQAGDAGQLQRELVRLARDLLQLKVENPTGVHASSRYLLKLFGYFQKHPHALLIMDNVADPEMLARASSQVHFAPLELSCNLLFTTRTNFALPGVSAQSIDVLSPEAAVKLLGRSRPIRTEEDQEAAAQICNAVGHLPLAVALIGAYLRNFPDISLGRYLATLRKGKLAAIDMTKIDASELATRHVAAVGVTLRSQWSGLRDAKAKLLIKLAAQFRDSTIVPTNRLRLLAGVGSNASELNFGEERSLNALFRLNVLERVENGSAVRVHPLIADFVRQLVPERMRSGLLRAAAASLQAAYADPLRLEAEYRARGINQLIEDFETATAWAAGDSKLAHKLRLQQRILDRERQQLQSPAPEQADVAANFFQQLHYRASAMGLQKLAAGFLNAGLQSGSVMLSFQASSALEDPLRVRTFQSHSVGLTSLAVTSDGSRLITASGEKATVWDVHTGQILRSVKGGKVHLQDVAIAPDGRRALAAGWGKRLISWDIETGQKLWSKRGHSDDIEFVELTADGNMAVTGSLDEELICWEVSSGRETARLKGHKHPVVAGAISPDGRYAISGDTDANLVLWDLEARSRIYKFHIDPRNDNIRRGITALSLSADAKVAAIATGYEDRMAVDYLGPDHGGRLLLWDLEAEDLIQEFTGHDLPVQDVAFSSDGRLLLSASSDKTVKLWAVHTGQCRRTLVGHSRSVQAVAFADHDRFAISGGWEGNAILWDIEGVESKEASGTPATSEGHSLWVRSADISPDGAVAVTSSDDRRVILWNAKTGQASQTLNDHEAAVNSVKLSRDASLAISGDQNGRIAVWDTKTGERVRGFETEKGSIHAVNISLDGRTAFSGSLYGWLALWDLETHELLHAFKHAGELDDDDADGILAIALSRDGSTAVTASEDSTILFVWDVEPILHLRSELIAADRKKKLTMQEFFQEHFALKRHSSGVLALDGDGEGHRLLSGSADHTVILWDLLRKRKLKQLEGHSQIVSSVAFAGAQRAVSTSWDRTVVVWDLDSARPAARLYVENPVWTVAAADQHVIAGDTGGLVYFFEIADPNQRPIKALGRHKKRKSP
jgi:WD40 repeat protein